MTKDWNRLAACVVRRRAELDGMTQEDLATISGLSVFQIQAIENMRAKNPRVRTIVALDKALQWEPGSVEAILAGDEPTPLPEPPAARMPTAVGRAIEDARRDKAMSVADAAAKARVSAEDWNRVLAEPEYRRGDLVTVGQMAHAVGLDSDDLMPINEEVADEMLRVEADQASRQFDYDSDAIDAAQKERARRIGMLNARQRELIDDMIDQFLNTKGA